jgi:hypothetical protein
LHLTLLWRWRRWLHLTLLRWWWGRWLYLTLLRRRWRWLHLPLLRLGRRLYLTLLRRRWRLARPLRRFFLLLLITLRRLRYHEGPFERCGVN